MARTRVFISRDKVAAKNTYDLWRGSGLRVTDIGPADAIDVTGTKPKISYESETGGDWFMVVGAEDQHGPWTG